MQNKEQHSQIGSSTPLNFGAFKFFDLILVITLFDKLALNLKHKSGVRRNVWGVALLAVGHGSWYGQLPLAPHLHPHQPHVPTLDHLTCADLELERLVRSLAGVELLVVGTELALVVHADQVALLQVFHLNTSFDSALGGLSWRGSIFGCFVLGSLGSFVLSLGSFRFSFFRSLDLRFSRLSNICLGSFSFWLGSLRICLFGGLCFAIRYLFICFCSLGVSFSSLGRLSLGLGGFSISFGGFSISFESFCVSFGSFCVSFSFGISFWSLNIRLWSFSTSLGCFRISNRSFSCHILSL